MQACYRRVRIEGGSSIPEPEQRTIRSALIDYGALQPSPVQTEEEGSAQTVTNSDVCFNTPPMAPRCSLNC